MKQKPSQKHMGYVAMAIGTLAVIYLIFVAAANVTVKIAGDELPRLVPMERFGSIEVGRNTYSLWTFEFEDKRCLWVAYVKRSGLTCWDKK